MIPVEGSRVAWIGEEVERLSIGDVATVLSAGERSSHVIFRSGVRANEVMLVSNYDLATIPVEAAWDSDLYGGNLVHCAVRETYDNRGPDGLLRALDREGHLATMAILGEEAVQYVATRLREDPSMREVLSQLDDDESNDFLSFTAEVLIRDALAEAG